ncbi:MAG: glycosyltransferase family 4 protein, partial [Candidatus Thermoplasmatota archaeon]
MKVAMVTPYWYPIRGGVTTFVAQLSEELRRSFGVEVAVIARQGSAPGATILGGDSRPFAALATRELERIRPDVVHAHGHWYCLLAAVRYAARHPEAKVVFTLHTEFSPPVRWVRWYLRRLLSRADFVTAVSADLLERTRRAFRFRTRTRIVRPGVSVTRSGEEEIQAFLRGTGLSGRRPILAFVGPLVYEAKARGVARAIRAMRRIAERHPGAVLAVAGDGSHRPSLERLAAKEAPGLVAFLGDIPDPVPLLSAADLSVHVSFQEGLPLAVLEAMACGTPVVATPVGGIPEVISDGENGILVSGDPDELADRISDLLDAPDARRRLAANAAEGAVS